MTCLKTAFTGQVTGMLDDVTAGTALAHHSFHVFVVYPWVRFLDRDPATPVRVMQACRVRWGTVVRRRRICRHYVAAVDVRRRGSCSQGRAGAGAVAQRRHDAGALTGAR